MKKAHAVIAVAAGILMVAPQRVAPTPRPCYLGVIRFDLAWVETVYDPDTGTFVPIDPADSTFAPPVPAPETPTTFVVCP